MEKHHDFATWVVDHGVKLNGISAHQFPGRGVGIIADKRHEVSAVVVN
jgi:hypothetical protein